MKSLYDAPDRVADSQADARRRDGWIGWVVGALLGAVVAGLVGWAASASQDRTEERLAELEAYTPPPRDRVAAALETFESKRVHVAPEARDLISAADQRRVDRLSAAAKVPVYVYVAAPTRDAGTEPLVEKDQLVAGLPDELGLLVVWQGPQGTNDSTALGDGDYFSGSELAGDPAVTLPQVIRDAQDLRAGTSAEKDPWGGTGGAVAFGAMIGLAILGVLALVIAFVPGGLRVLRGGRD